MRDVLAKGAGCLLAACLFVYALHLWGHQPDRWVLLAPDGALAGTHVNPAACFAAGEARYPAQAFECARK